MKDFLEKIPASLALAVIAPISAIVLCFDPQTFLER
jgi:hypothetical protein